MPATPDLDRHPKDGLPVLQLPDQQAWEEWLEANHDSAAGAWLKTAKKSASQRTVTHPEALESAICFGWIDGQRVPYDECFFLQRFTPRKVRSKWSQINRDKAQKLIAEQRMRAAGLAQVEAAKRDGRWENAYAPQSAATVPDDFQQALDRDPQAKAFFETLRGQNRYAFLYRLQNVKRPETRQKRIDTYVEMLNERRTFYP
jgi:uncharacterized protein YdeI (YjbR/CyaY-like superfamily)